VRQKLELYYKPLLTVHMEQVVAAVAGFASHVIYFRKGEHHLNGPKYIQIFVAAIVASTAFLVYEGYDQLWHSVLRVLGLAVCYLSGLYVSLILYRLFLHPLNRFPGPVGARISNLWLSLQLKDFDSFRKHRTLHDKYGFFVRVGSSDLSITHPKAVDIIYSSKSRCTKAAWYDIGAPRIALQTFRVKAMHDQRRRAWSAAFSDKALRGYEQRMRVYQNKLMEQLATFNGKSVNATKWFNLYSFDVMGDLAFGKSFNMLENEEEHWAIKLLNDGMKPLGLMFPVWFFRILTSIPFLSRDWWRFIGFVDERLEERMKVISPKPGS
jgi:tryprostatin B 6-hydroxylase